MQEAINNQHTSFIVNNADEAKLTKAMIKNWIQNFEEIPQYDTIFNGASVISKISSDNLKNEDMSAKIEQAFAANQKVRESMQEAINNQHTSFIVNNADGAKLPKAM